MTAISIDGSMHIRRATRDDASAISALILSLAQHFTLKADGSGAETFLLALQPSGIERNIEVAEFVYYVGTVDGQLAGVVAVRGKTHLYHLFVDEAFQRRGLAKALWSYVKAEYEWPCASVATTVNSTPFALPFYEAVGFRTTGPRVETNGIAFIPMKLSRE